MLWVKLRYYCAYMSVFKGRKFKISVIAYFDIFQLKPITKPDNIHAFTKIPILSLFKEGICSSKFQICDTFSLFTQFSHFSYTISYCFSPVCAYLTSVPGSEQIIALFRSLGAIHMLECYTHTPIISSNCHVHGDSN